MRRFHCATLAAFAVFSFTSVASAAPPVAMPFSWTGFYVGANIGGGWGTNHSANFAPNDPDSAALFGVGFMPGSTDGFAGRGALGGLQLGYNWQLNRNWLVGLEADFDLSGMNFSGVGNSPFIDVGFGPLSVTTMNVRVDWFSTIRARLGYLPMDNLLTYLTGGLAFGRIDSSGNNGFLGSVTENIGGFGFLCAGSAVRATCLAGSSRSTAAGWTLGGGLEYAVSKNWTLKAEYLYVDLGNHTTTLTALVPNGTDALTSFNANYTTSFNVVRGGLNYRF